MGPEAAAPAGLCAQCGVMVLPAEDLPRGWEHPGRGGMAGRVGRLF